MHLNNPEDAMPWVGLYVCLASLVCTLAMAANAFQGFRQRKLWFPCRFFTLNSVSITVIAIAMKLPLDLTTIKPDLSTPKENSGDVNVKVASILFLITMLANFLPSLGLMNDRELLFNILALALTVPASRRILEHQYRELHELDLDNQDIIFSSKELVHTVKKYWMMAETVSCGWYFFKSLLKRFKKEPNVSNTDANSEMKEYTRYVLQIEDDAKFSERVIRNTLNSIAQLLQESKEKESSNLLKFLHKSRRFDGVKQFHNEQVPPLYSEETKNSWSLVTVTLTAISLALPNIANSRVEGLLASMKEGLQFVRHVEESLNANTDLVKARKAAKSVWTEVEVYHTWLQINLQKKAHKGRKSKEILQWLGDEAVKIVIQFKSCKKQSLDHSLYKFLVAGSMYRISQSILLHFNEQENWPNDDEIFEWISNVIADVLCACLTNLPRVIKMKCHHDAIEKRGDNIRAAAHLLGKSKRILKILKARQLPNLDMDSMAYIDKWHALPESWIVNDCNSSTRVQLASESSNESLIVSIM